MRNLRVGVLRGGPSSEYETSLQTGASVLKNLPEGMSGIDIFIGRNGAWHINGIPTKEGDALSRVDVVWNALHGKYGEDGTVQRTLELFKIPYTGSEPHASFLGMHKAHTKESLAGQGIRMPRHSVVEMKNNTPEQNARTVFETSSPPWVIKPIDGGSSIGVFIARTFPALVSVFSQIAAQGDSKAYLVEELVRGKEATVGVVENFRGEDFYALPPIEIRLPPESSFFDYDAKYSGKSDEICPGNFSKSEKEELINAAKVIHRRLGLRHYSRSDFIVSPHGIYFLETNTLPGLTEESLFPKALHAVGVSLRHFIEHVLRRTTKSV